MKYITIIVAGVIFWAIAEGVSIRLQGEKPKLTYGEYLLKTAREKYFDDRLWKLSDKIKRDPQNLAALKEFADALNSKISGSEGSSHLVMELVSTLKRILDISPDDENALYNLATISFRFGVFSKAAGYFRKYLNLNPSDYKARTLFAESLSAIGEFDSAESEFSRVFEEKKGYFPAIAGRAINYLRLGDIENSRLLYKEAIKEAPDEITKKQFEELYKKVEEKGPQKIAP